MMIINMAVRARVDALRRPRAELRGGDGVRHRNHAIGESFKVIHGTTPT